MYSEVIFDAWSVGSGFLIIRSRVFRQLLDTSRPLIPTLNYVNICLNGHYFNETAYENTAEYTNEPPIFISVVESYYYFGYDLSMHIASIRFHESI